MNLNVAFHRQLSVFLRLYNCGSFMSFAGYVRFHLKWPLQYDWKLRNKTFKGAAIEFFQHTHPPSIRFLMQL
jgi:hypothetical protein